KPPATSPYIRRSPATSPRSTRAPSPSATSPSSAWRKELPPSTAASSRVFLPRLRGRGTIAQRWWKGGAALKRQGSGFPPFRLAPGPPSPKRGKGTLPRLPARQNRRVTEERLAPFWPTKLAYAFRL